MSTESNSPVDPADAANPSDEPEADTVVFTEQLGTSDAALSFDEARRLTSRRGALLVMFAGEVDTGKTTLLVEIWTDLLLHGRIGSCDFAGSTTALAFEERSFQSRLSSRRESPDTLRTNEEDDGLLHLRIKRSDRRLLELLLTDMTGEHFRAIREGRPLDEEFDWLSRRRSVRGTGGRGSDRQGRKSGNSVHPNPEAALRSPRQRTRCATHPSGSGYCEG